MTKANRRRLMERKIVEQLASGKGFNVVCCDLRVGRNPSNPYKGEGPRIWLSGWQHPHFPLP